jgi:hypothetical protein
VNSFVIFPKQTEDLNLIQVNEDMEVDKDMVMLEVEDMVHLMSEEEEQLEL